MSKRNIILTESQISKLFKNVIKETRRFENQEMVDAILDKINELGYESLTDEEKNILNNPDEKIKTKETTMGLKVKEQIANNPILSMLIDAGFLNPHDIMILDDNVFQVNILSDDDGNLFKYFDEGNSIRLITHVDGNELMVEADDESDINSKMEVMEYIKEMWEGLLGIPVYVDGIDF
jgi:hypothetical protein